MVALIAAWTMGVRIAPPVMMTDLISSMVRFAISNASRMGCVQRGIMSAHIASSFALDTFVLKSTSSIKLST